MVSAGIIIPIIYYIVTPLIITALFLRKTEKKSYLAGVGILAIIMIIFVVLVIIMFVVLERSWSPYGNNVVLKAVRSVGMYLIGMYGIVLVFGTAIAVIVNLILLYPIVKLIRKYSK